MAEIYPLVRVQRCLVHKIRSRPLHPPRGGTTPPWPKPARRLGRHHPVWAATTRKEALAAVKAFEACWWVEEERACGTLRPDLHECLASLAFPEEDHNRIRTTTALKGAFREAR